MRDLTPTESLLRKALSRPSRHYDEWSTHGDGYEVESTTLTDEEADVLRAAHDLVTCPTCGRVIEDGDRSLTVTRRHWTRTYCEIDGAAYLANHPDTAVRDA